MYVEFFHNRAHALPFYLLVKEEATNDGKIYAFHIDTKNFVVFDKLESFFDCITYICNGNPFNDSLLMPLNEALPPSAPATSAPIPLAAPTPTPTPAPATPPLKKNDNQHLADLIQKYEFMRKWSMSEFEAAKLVDHVNKNAINNTVVDYYNQAIEAYLLKNNKAKKSGNTYGNDLLKLQVKNESTLLDRVKKRFYAAAAAAALSHNNKTDVEKDDEIKMVVQTLKRNGQTVRGGILSPEIYIQAANLQQHIQIPADIEKAKEIVLAVNDDCDDYFQNKPNPPPLSLSHYYMTRIHHYLKHLREGEEDEDTGNYEEKEIKVSTSDSDDNNVNIFSREYYNTKVNNNYYVYATKKVYESLQKAGRRYDDNYEKVENEDDKITGCSPWCSKFCSTFLPKSAKKAINYWTTRFTQKKKR